MNDILSANPVEIYKRKQVLKFKFYQYVPSEYNVAQNVYMLDKIFEQLFIMTPDFDKDIVVASLQRLLPIDIPA
jgi:hypothetical protein